MEKTGGRPVVAVEMASAVAVAAGHVARGRVPHGLREPCTVRECERGRKCVREGGSDGVRVRSRRATGPRSSRRETRSRARAPLPPPRPALPASGEAKVAPKHCLKTLG